MCRCSRVGSLLAYSRTVFASEKIYVASIGVSSKFIGKGGRASMKHGIANMFSHSVVLYVYGRGVGFCVLIYRN
jgi:hypothetical protein